MEIIKSLVLLLSLIFSIYWVLVLVTHILLKINIIFTQTLSKVKKNREIGVYTWLVAISWSIFYYLTIHYK